MKNILANAFSLQMINLNEMNMIGTEPITLDEVKSYLKNGFTSAIGHQDTANVLSELLGVSVEFNRCNIFLDKDTNLIVAQVIGGRLPEGATTLPDGVSIKFIKIRLL